MSPRLVVVHERFTELGGSEQVVRQLARMADDVRLYAPIIDEDHLPADLLDVERTASRLQLLYPGGGRYAHLLPLLPVAMATARLDDADLVIASHHAFANRVRVPSGVPLISYTHSPARWMWDTSKRRGEPGGPLASLALTAFAAAARAGDRRAAARADLIVANSNTVAGRIRRWWGREPRVINPPVDVDRFTPGLGGRDDFFLVAGRLVPYKRVDVAVAAANLTGRRLIVAGNGRSRPELEAMAGPTVEFTGSVSDFELRDLFQRCTALVFPGEEDFGIVPVEAQACGAPVIASGIGGATETVIPGTTGALIDPDEDQVEAFAKALAGHDPAAYDPTVIRANAERFSIRRFHERFESLLAEWIPGRRSRSGR